MRAALVLVALLLSGCASAPPAPQPPSASEPVVATPTPVVTPAPEPEAPVSRFALAATAEGDADMPQWRVAGGDEPAARIVVPAASVVTVDLDLGERALHGLVLDGATLVAPTTGARTVSFVTPLDGRIEYLCPVHPSTMVGEILVADAPGPTLGTIEGWSHVGLIPSADVALNATQSGHVFFFETEDSSVRNPVIAVAPDAEIEVTLQVETGVHNLRIVDLLRTPIGGEGESFHATFRSPAKGEFEYWCEPHRGSGMRGTLVVVPRWTSEAPLRALDLQDPAIERDARVGERVEWRNAGDAPLLVEVGHGNGSFRGVVPAGGSLVALAASEGSLLVTARGDGALHGGQAVTRHLVHVA